MANKQRQRCSTSLAIKEIKTKTKWDTYTSIRMAMIKKSVDVTAIADGCEFLAFLNFLYLFRLHYKQVMNGSTSYEPYSVVQLLSTETYYSHLNVTKKLKHSGLPNLNSSQLAGSRTCIQTDQQCPEEPVFVLRRLTPSACSSPCACIILIYVK